MCAARYVLAQFSAALLVCALTVPQLSKPLRGRPPPALQRLAKGTHRVVTGLFKKKMVLSAGPSVHSFVDSFVDSFVRSFVDSFIHSFIHSFVDSFIFYFF